jgi:hypothetical protein
VPVQGALRLALVLATAALATACASTGRTRPAPDSYATAHWDSGPLNLDYERLRGDMDARHAQEVASPTPGESAYARSLRQDRENKDLEARYAEGEATHAQSVPGAEPGETHLASSHP